MSKAARDIHIDHDLEGYVVDIVQKTREDSRVAVGASPRGSLAFLKMARANAALNSRDYVTPDDIKRFDIPILAHRIIMQPAHWMAPRMVNNVINDVFNSINVPVLD